MIVVTVREADLAVARRRVAQVGAGADRVEIRLDDLAGQDWQGLVAGSRQPVIATCRSRREGGGFSGSEGERVAILREAARAGATWVDVELGSAAESLLEELPAERLLLSHHEHNPGTGHLDRVWARLRSAPSAVTLKLAYTPARCSDCLAGRDLLARARSAGRKVALVTMGEAGVPGRLMALAWGAAWSYAAPDGAPPAAPGQLSLFEMAEVYRVHEIDNDTVLTGLLGWPIGSSLSPWMHNRAAAAAGLNARYLPFPEQDAADFILNMPAWNLVGAGVTQPHKEAVMRWMTEITAPARGCGAVNTVSRRGAAGLVGDNTDAPAALRALREAWPDGNDLVDLRVAILGAGGAARGVAWALRDAGAVVTLHGRRMSRVMEVARAVDVAAAGLDEVTRGGYDVLVNATPVGTWPDSAALPVPANAVGGRLVFDLVSNPEITGLLDSARGQGIAVQTGVTMLVRQGEAQFRAWHGRAAPPGAFLAGAREGLRRTAGRSPGL